MVRADEDKLTLSTTFKQQFATYELSLPKADALDQVAALYRAAFQPLNSF
jgi:hypothetical protein